MTERDRKGAQDNETKRKRGVRASPARLRQAMIDAGITSQTQLAERIADLEKLETLPRSLVNKVFRGESVDPLSIERVARALSTEGWKIYLTADEPEPAAAQPAADSTDPGDDAPPILPPQIPQAVVVPSTEAVRSKNPLAFAARYLWAALLVLGAALVTWLYVRAPSTSPLAAATPIYVRVESLSGEGSDELMRALLQADTSRVRFLDAKQREYEQRSQTEPAGSLTLAGELTRLGRLSDVRFFAVTKNDSARHELMSSIVPANKPQAAIGELSAAVVAYVERRAAKPSLPHAAANDYLYGRIHLDATPSELNLRRAQGRFESALRQAPDFALAQAGLCQTLISQRWISDEPQEQAGAQAVCKRAREMDEDSTVMRVAYANLLSITGRTAESSLMLEEVLARDPHNTDALLSLANVQFEEFRKSGTKSFLESAAQHAGKSIATAPDFWRTHWMLGLIEFHRGNVDSAIRALEEAAALDANDLVLVNLGTSRFCRGQVAQARDAFMQARQVTENPRLGEEFLGTFAFYSGDFAQSVAYRKQAIDRLKPENGPYIHQVWGDLGDSYRHSGQAKSAAAAYERAMEILRDDFAQGNATESDRAYRAYYRLTSSKTTGKPLGGSERDEIFADLDAASKADTEPSALVRIAISWRMLGEHQLSKQASQRASARCVVYRDHPDLRHASNGGAGGGLSRP